MTVSIRKSSTNELPRLQTESEYDAALVEIERYFVAEPQPGSADAARFDALAGLIEEYEDANWWFAGEEGGHHIRGGRRLSYPIIDIEGIGKTFAEKLGTAGIKTTADLLESGKDPKGRKALAKATGIDEAKILNWTNKADLMRIKGVGEEYSDLLEAAGVDTVKELKTRRADNLTAKMAEVNAARKLVRQLPSEKSVAGWIDQAKDLPAILTY